MVWKDTEASRAHIDKVKSWDTHRIAQESAHKLTLEESKNQAKKARDARKAQEEAEANTRRAARLKKY